jgi:SSS family solute:Na+ symporter
VRSLIVILPGCRVWRCRLPGASRPVGKTEALAAGQHTYNELLRIMLARYCGPAVPGLGVTALIAGVRSATRSATTSTVDLCGG